MAKADNPTLSSLHDELKEKLHIPMPVSRFIEDVESLASDMQKCNTTTASEIDVRRRLREIIWIKHRVKDNDFYETAYSPIRKNKDYYDSEYTEGGKWMTFKEAYQQIRKHHYEILNERESISKSARLSLSTWVLDILTECREADTLQTDCEACELDGKADVCKICRVSNYEPQTDCGWM